MSTGQVLPSLLVCLVISLVFHELGHGLAAATERVRTEGVLYVSAFYVTLASSLVQEWDCLSVSVYLGPS